MKLESFKYEAKKGWSTKFPELDSDKSVVFVFGAPEFIDNPEQIKELVGAYPKSTIVGCSSAGEVFQDQVNDHSLSVAVAQFSGTTIKSACVPISSGEESHSVGKQLAEELNSSDLVGILVFSDGLNVNGSHLVDGITSLIDKKVIVTGGLAGDGANFEKTWVIDHGSPKSGVVTAVGLYGDKVQITHGSQGGWDKFGPERIITKSKDNVLFELDGKPALELYKQYLGEKAEDLPASGLLFPLQIRPNEDKEKKLVRTILAVNEDDQSMTFAGNVPEGSLAQLMHANFDRLIDGAGTAAKTLEVPDKPCLAIAISCVGRRLVLGERIEEEVEATLEKIPKGSKQVGFYSYGEISPHEKGKTCELHNQTMTLTAITEAS